MELSGPLQGMRVVDLSQFYIAPQAAATLGEMGAEVIKVERPGSGDETRGTLSFLGVSTVSPVASNTVFFDNNRNKKSITVDLKKAEGKEIIYRLVDKSDVFITNDRRPAVARMGVDYETLSRINPRLVYGISSGYGERGPDANAPAFALTVAARGGLMMTCCGDGDAPIWTASELGDSAGALLLSIGILGALLEREKTGRGKEVVTSQLMAQMQLQRLHIATKLLTGREPPRFQRKNPNNPVNSYYRCKDDRWIAIAIMRYKDWPIFCKAIGHPDMENAPQFTYWMRRRHGESLAPREKAEEAKYRQATVQFLEEMFATRTQAEWLQVFREADVMAAAVNGVTDLINDPQVVANEYISEWEHPALGAVRFITPPFRSGNEPLTYDAPELGQHTEEVLTEICGYSWEEVASFKERGVI